jgi:hypothetical protein
MAELSRSKKEHDCTDPDRHEISSVHRYSISAESTNRWMGKRQQRRHGQIMFGRLKNY